MRLTENQIRDMAIDFADEVLREADTYAEPEEFERLWQAIANGILLGTDFLRSNEKAGVR